MPTCQYCDKQWSYATTLKKLFRNKMVCPYCHNMNYITTKARWRLSVISMPVMFVGLPLGIFDIPLKWSIPIAATMLIISFCLYPNFMELSKEEEPLF
ncbi:TIGR04104 family putative zinc finger protein [Virgibacillus ndiopensis]|uniref:TIGR04104 family putative zinc finger protein n=1 Tax=Virgibacillus ndiopensis TaxID=2004408 RepID=UPI000C0847BD|nr:TIGR04104 family putative zinc finger protein [Virgibacillus ndiopensis]